MRLVPISTPLTRRSLVALAPFGLGACSPLTAFNTLVPKDGGVRRVAADQAFGPDPRQRLDVYAPLQRSASAPVLVFFYGGSWATGRRQDYRFAAEAFAAKGFVVVLPDYRLVPQVRFPRFVEDGAAAVRWAQDHARDYGGDPSRIALAGHSAGAYIAMMLALDRRWLTRAGVDPAAIRAVAGLSGPYDFYPFDVPSSQNAFGQYPDPRATQPISFARGDAPPAFLATGDRDTTVRPRNSQALAAALKAKGAQAELHIYPGLDHAGTVLALSRPFRRKSTVLADASQFLWTHSGPGATGC